MEKQIYKFYREIDSERIPSYIGITLAYTEEEALDIVQNYFSDFDQDGICHYLEPKSNISIEKIISNIDGVILIQEI